MSDLSIGSHLIGSQQPAFIIAEIAQNHDGSLGLAHAYIDAAAEAKADAVKFQTHIADQESTYDEPFRVKFSGQDDTRYAYWKRMEFTAEQWEGLARHAADKNLVFLSSAFSLQAVELLDRIGIPAWKVGSGEFRSTDLSAAMVQTGKPILVSTGMSTWSEIDAITHYFQQRQHPFGLFQCTSMYPTPSESVGLNVIEQMRERYECPIGLSDHSGQPFASLAALARSIDLIEVHLTFDKRMFGPDVSASLTIDDLKLVTAARTEFAAMDAHPVDKDGMAQHLNAMRALFTKSVAPTRALKAGEVLTPSMLMAKKPGTGIPYVELDRLIGQKLQRDVSADRLLTWEDMGVENA
ncbi:MAG: N-acetylneuraminate synthase [Leptolyngbya sp. SIOISBB]|nr:N-acetylneuraminate synthase [Leptolyngbya sp. SIOISBB]